MSQKPISPFQLKPLRRELLIGLVIEEINKQIQFNYDGEQAKVCSNHVLGTICSKINRNTKIDQPEYESCIGDILSLYRNSGWSVEETTQEVRGRSVPLYIFTVNKSALQNPFGIARDLVTGDRVKFVGEYGTCEKNGTVASQDIVPTYKRSTHTAVKYDGHPDTWVVSNERLRIIQESESKENTP